MMCNECTCQCANQREKVRETAKNFRNPVAIMNQATYESMMGLLEIDGIPVEIEEAMQDRTFMITGTYLGEM